MVKIPLASQAVTVAKAMADLYAEYVAIYEAWQKADDQNMAHCNTQSRLYDQIRDLKSEVNSLKAKLRERPAVRKVKGRKPPTAVEIFGRRVNGA